MLSSTSSSILQQPSNEPNGAMVFLARKTFNAHRVTTTNAAFTTYDGDCSNGAAALAGRPGGDDTFRDREIVSDDNINT